jgi:hypothetical protein
MTTSLSDRFHAGDTVWQAWAYVDAVGRPRTRIRKATFQPVPGSHLGPLLRFEDGTAEFHCEIPDHRIYADREGAVRHCIRVLADARHRIHSEIDRLMEEHEEYRGGPAPGSETPAGTAPPEVAR